MFMYVSAIKTVTKLSNINRHHKLEWLRCACDDHQIILQL